MHQEPCYSALLGAEKREGKPPVLEASDPRGAVTHPTALLQAAHRTVDFYCRMSYIHCRMANNLAQLQHRPLKSSQAHLASGADAVPLAARGQSACVASGTHGREEGSRALGVSVHVGIRVDGGHLWGLEGGARQRSCTGAVLVEK